VFSNDLALAVSRFFTDVSVSDNLLVTIGICCARTAALGCVTDNVIEVFCIFGKILLLEFLITFTVTLCSNFNLVMLKVCSN